MTRFLRIVLVFVLLDLVATGVWMARNPERERLTTTARAAAPGSLIQLSQGVTHFDIAGPDTGRVAVLVHGFSVPSYIWDSTFQALSAAGVRVIRYDLFGRGWSDRPRGAYDGAFYDAQLGELLNALLVTQKVDLFGLSFGGFVVAHFAATYPERVRSVTLVDPVTASREVPWYIAAPVLGPYLFQVMAVPTMAEGQTSDFLHPERFPDWVDRYRVQMQYRGFGRALRRSIVGLGSADFDDMYSRIARSEIPVLLIWGRQDSTQSIAGAEAVRRRIPQLEFFPVDSAGHLPHLEQSAIVNARILAFLAR